MFGLSEQQIISFIARDEKVFGEFYNASIDIFYRYMKGRYFFQHESDIDDILSDIYMKIWKGMQKYDSRYSLEGYIWSIYKNHVKDYFKKKRLDYSQDDEMGNRVDQNSGEDMFIETAQQEYTLEKIYNAMQELDESQYQILFFKLVEGYSYEEISDKLGVSQAALRKRFSRALTKLKEKLDGEEGLGPSI